jgi:hypothetical protein
MDILIGRTRQDAVPGFYRDDVAQQTASTAICAQAQC